MTDKTVAVNQSRMGRPPLGIVSTTVRLAEATLVRIDALMGPNRRAQFIREAVEAELARRAQPEPTSEAQELAKPQDTRHVELPVGPVSAPPGSRLKKR